MLLAKVYVENGTVLVLECANKECEDLFPCTGTRFGCVVKGKDNIAISNEAKVLFKHIVYKAEKTEDDLSCLDIYKADDDKLVLSWVGDNLTKIDYDKLSEIGFWVGTGESQPQLNLLDSLVLADNKTLKNLDINDENVVLETNSEF